MKKTIAFLLALLLICFSATACGQLRIQSESWSFVIATQGEAVTHVAPAYLDSTLGGTPTLEGTLTAGGGEFTFTDKTNGKTYTGTYEDREEVNPNAVDYRITVGRTRGRALISNGLTESGKETTTLTLYLGNYTLLFVAEE